MNDLEPLDSLSKELLDAARDGHAPPAEGRERVRRRVVARIGAAAFASSAVATAGIGLTKAVAVVGVVLIGGGAGYYAMHRTPEPAATTLAAAPTISSSSSQRPVAVASVEAPVPPAPPASSAPPAPSVAPAASVRRPPPTPSLPAPPSIGEETSLLAGAQSALRAGDAKGALSLLERHRERYPSGALAEEREASRVLALCKLGRVAEARSAADTFVTAHPRSPAVPRVRAACAPDRR